MNEERSTHDGRAGQISMPGVFGLLLCVAVAALAACKPDGPTDPAPPAAETFSVTLQWNAPTQDALGEPLDDLAGYRIHYRSSSPANGPGATIVEVADVTQATVDGVPAGQWHFSVTAHDASGNESTPSNEVQVEVGS
ncbi:MAG TPA: fibronectin type III domain-containing protein [Gemmatimonadota bacterium]|nr:fibronectin type III domain-containing protein [Gemmatimonadota bacterium]